MFQTFTDQLMMYGPHLFGAFMVAIAFNVFYGKNTQYARFQLISYGFWVVALVNLTNILIPLLPALNPAIQISDSVMYIYTNIFYAVASGLFLASLFPSLSPLARNFAMPVFFVIICLAVSYGILFLRLGSLEKDQIPNLILGISLLVAAMGFHTIPTITHKAIFTAPRFGLLSLGGYFVLRAFNLITPAASIPVMLYGLVAIIVLIAQLRFMETAAITAQHAFETEKKRKTLFWDVAPFPILLTKLIDDSVVYMNSACQKVLGLDDTQKANLHFSNYFVDTKKRDELIKETKEKGVVDGFEVELNVQNAKKTLWITLSSRVFEVEGELVLYINFTNITEQKETEQELFIQASTDTLTGLYNRRQFAAMTEQAFALSRRDGTPYCVVMLDIDHFKNINDTYGHDAGDIVLKNLAEKMKQTMRKSDIIARWGGEEFIIFLMDTDPRKALNPANKLREAVQAMTVSADGKEINFTISLGVSLSQVPDIAIIQKEADLALYHSKENGRNQVTLYSQEFAEMPTDLESDR
ncbi:MAG: sensor domain-containing diguanylate cyclase [Alphaproteobacteria bacterium]|nr:sensor domain-containing diguanylate cyclase [Alphaproteobacteria bacterium]